MRGKRAVGIGKGLWRSGTPGSWTDGETTTEEETADTPVSAVSNLKPILLSGGGRTGSTAIMELLGSDPRVALDREYPFENRYLLYFTKFALLLERPDFFQFLDGQQLFDPAYLGFSGPPPAATYVPSYAAEYLPRLERAATLKELWSLFSRRVVKENSTCEFYAEKSPPWLAPIVREFLPCYTIYNIRDPRDIFISANAFIKKRNNLGFSRLAEDTDVDHARHLALAFANTFENYRADRKRADCMLMRYEDFVLRPEQIAEDLRRLCGLAVRGRADSEFFSVHRTAKDLEHTVHRWKRDPIPRDVALFLERALRAEMSELGYEITEPRQNSHCSTVSLAGGADLSRMACSPDGYLAEAAECAVVKIRGIDFWVILPLDPFEAAPVKEVWVSARGDIGEVFSLYWHGPNGDFSEERTMTVRYTPSPHWTVLSFPVYAHPRWQGTIAKLRLDLFNANKPPHQGSGQVRWVRLVR